MRYFPIALALCRHLRRIFFSVRYHDVQGALGAPTVPWPVGNRQAYLVRTTLAPTRRLPHAWTDPLDRPRFPGLFTPGHVAEGRRPGLYLHQLASLAKMWRLEYPPSSVLPPRGGLQVQLLPTPAFGTVRGGVLCDAPGLGKTGGRPPCANIHRTTSRSTSLKHTLQHRHRHARHTRPDLTRTPPPSFLPVTMLAHILRTAGTRPRTLALPSSRTQQVGAFLGVAILWVRLSCGAIQSVATRVQQSSRFGSLHHTSSLHSNLAPAAS